jgi:hypothetical protein
MGSTLDDYPELKEEHEWTKTIRGESEWSWPFSPKPLSPKQPSIFEGDLNSDNTGSAVMDWTAAQLIRPPKMEDVCPVCKIDNKTMLSHECWDKNCPKGQDAN